MPITIGFDVMVQLGRDVVYSGHRMNSGAERGAVAVSSQYRLVGLLVIGYWLLDGAIALPLKSICYLT